MAETLDTLATKIDALGVAIDQRFDQVGQQFGQVDLRFDELKTELLVRIEAVDAKVGLALERMDDFLGRDVANSAAYARIDSRIESHDLRITALEHGEPRKG